MYCGPGNVWKAKRGAIIIITSRRSNGAYYVRRSTRRGVCDDNRFHLPLQRTFVVSYESRRLRRPRDCVCRGACRLIAPPPACDNITYDNYCYYRACRYSSPTLTLTFSSLHGSIDKSTIVTLV